MKKIKKIEPPVFDARGYQTNISDLNGEPLPDLASLKWQHYHGGARLGAGRKPSGNVPVLLRLPPEIAMRLRVTAKREGVTISAVATRELASV